MKKINIALVGLGFGGCFLPIYLDHPDVERVGIYDTDTALLRAVKGRHKQAVVYQSFEEILSDQTLDAVHLVTPIPLHADQTVAVLESGKHCACTVPMACSLEDLQRITNAVKKSGKNYMMMETTLYTYQFFYVERMLRQGELGKIQFMRGSHYQDMANWPDYWLGLPPMWYGTHAISPMTVLSGSRICRVHCFGSGTMEESLCCRYHNPYPVECAIFEFENGMKGEATRSLFETARAYQEGLFVYGNKASFEWGFADGDAPYVTTAVPTIDGKRGSEPVIRQIDLPNFHQSLPGEIQKYTIRTEDFDPLNPQLSLQKGQGGGHHGSHPHLVHEFVRSILENRKARIDETLGANICAAGICAHESAIRDGEAVIIPTF